jgi:hypothetical protein
MQELLCRHCTLFLAIGAAALFMAGFVLGVVEPPGGAGRGRPILPLGHISPAVRHESQAFAGLA